jgi:UrcA family protein
MRVAISTGLKLGGAVAGTLLLAGVVQSLHAQPAPPPPGYTQEIPVLAPEVVRQRVGTGRHRQPIEVASLTMPVSYADLDLTKPAGQKVLKDRIWAQAREACRQLNARTPVRLFGAPGGEPCIADAASESLKIADQVIAAANA